MHTTCTLTLLHHLCLHTSFLFPALLLSLPASAAEASSAMKYQRRHRRNEKAWRNENSGVSQHQRKSRREISRKMAKMAASMAASPKSGGGVMAAWQCESAESILSASRQQRSAWRNGGYG
jgi:hypothetical protein